MSKMTVENAKFRRCRNSPRTLIYLRQNVNHTVVGQLFGVSADTSENVFYEVIPILQREFSSQKWEAEKKWRKYEEKWSPKEVDYLLIDSFETPIGRASVNEKQKKKYSGKKKMHTLKSQLITDQDGEIIQIEAGFDGPRIGYRNLSGHKTEKRMVGEREVRR